MSLTPLHADTWGTNKYLYICDDRETIVTNVREAMSSPAVVLRPNQSILEAAKLMDERDIGCIVVASPDAVMGIITENDLVRRVILRGLDYDAPVSQAMTSPAFTVRPDVSLEEAIHLMSNYSIKRLVVLENNKAIGVIAYSDIWRNIRRGSSLTD